MGARVCLLARSRGGALPAARHARRRLLVPARARVPLRRRGGGGVADRSGRSCDSGGASGAALVASGIGASQALAVALSVGALGVLSGSAIFLVAVAWRSGRSLLATRTRLSRAAAGQGNWEVAVIVFILPGFTLVWRLVFQGWILAALVQTESKSVRAPARPAPRRSSPGPARPDAGRCGDRQAAPSGRSRGPARRWRGPLQAVYAQGYQVASETISLPGERRGRQ